MTTLSLQAARFSLRCSFPLKDPERPRESPNLSPKPVPTQAREARRPAGGGLECGAHPPGLTENTAGVAALDAVDVDDPPAREDAARTVALVPSERGVWYSPICLGAFGFE